MVDPTDVEVEMARKECDVSRANQEGWTAEQHEYVRRQTEKSRNMMWIHERSSRLCQRKHYMVVIPTLFITSTISAAELGRTSTGEDLRGMTPLRLGLLALLSTFLTSLSNLLKYGERAVSHASAVSQYQRLITDLEATNLLDDRSGQPAFQSYITTVVTTQENITSSAPSPPMSVIDWFNKHFTVDRPDMPMILRTGD